MKTSRSAFTLIEMLVVISVIALLITITIPIITSASSTARLLECKTNLKSLGDASHSYATDNDGQFIQGPGGGRALQTIQPPEGTVAARQQWEGYLSNYSTEEGSPSMYCPFFEGDALHSWPNGWNNYSELTDRFGPGFYWMGYANFAYPGNARSNASDSQWRAREAGPSFVDATPSDMPLFGDVIEGNVNGNLTEWVHYSHSEGLALAGGGVTSDNPDDLVGPEGFHNVYADGSVNWTTFSPNSDEIEVSFSAQRQDNIGFLWNYQSRQP